MIQTLKHKLKTIYSNKLTLYTAPLFVFLLFFIATPSVYAESTTGKLALKVSDIIFGNMAKGIASFIEYIAKFIMFLGSQFLDLTISFSLNTGNLKMAAITDTWTIARDVTNMLFIFILLYVGIMLILRMSNFQTKKNINKPYNRRITP